MRPVSAPRKVNPEEIRETELFKGISPPDFEKIFRLAQQKKIEEGAFFFMEGDPVSAIFLMIEGKVKLVQVTPQGQQVIHGYVGKGEVFGLVTALDLPSYPVSAQAVIDSLALYWYKRDIDRLTESYPRISRNINRILAQKILVYQDRIRELATQRVERRIARTLLRLAQQIGRKTASGVLIDMPLTRQDMAEMTGTTLFTASRTLKQWESKGLIYSKRGKVIIRYPHGLVSIAEDFVQEESPIIALPQRPKG